MALKGHGSVRGSMAAGARVFIPVDPVDTHFMGEHRGREKDMIRARQLYHVFRILQTEFHFTGRPWPFESIAATQTHVVHLPFHVPCGIRAIECEWAKAAQQNLTW